ncbi:response regulator receiver domain, partial [Shewanella sp. A3A]|nr:response regulator receiver domain [Shewanella ferrihydritica]
MSETALTYQDLINEAFIDPIRTVTVIDDEYPTFKELLEGFNDEGFSLGGNIERLKKISEMCHNTHKWSLDVFNGKSPRIGGNDYISEHLNHSDLVILDYHLDGEPTSDNGERARNIIKNLDSNNHFNIILVHTKGVDEDIKEVYEEILFDLHNVKIPAFLIVDDDNLSLIEDWLDNNNDGEGYSWLEHSLGFEKTKLLKLLECKVDKIALGFKNPNHIFYPYKEQISAIANDSGVSTDDLIKWRLLEICNQQQISFSDASRGDLIWDLPEGEANFIATGRVFVSVIRKVSDDPETELYQALCNSLKKYNASPMHLLMAKIRHEIDERGFEQAQSIIANRQAQAGWLFTLLSSSSDNFVHDKAIDLHWEQLGRASKSSLRAFSHKISNVLSGQQEPKQVVKGFFRECIGNSDESCGQLNCSGQQKLATVLEFSQYNRSDSLGVK